MLCFIVLIDFKTEKIPIKAKVKAKKINDDVLAIESNCSVACNSVSYLDSSRDMPTSIRHSSSIH